MLGTLCFLLGGVLVLSRLLLTLLLFLALKLLCFPHLLQHRNLTLAHLMFKGCFDSGEIITTTTTTVATTTTTAVGVIDGS